MKLKIVQWIFFLVRFLQIHSIFVVYASLCTANKHRVILKHGHPDYIHASYVNVRLYICSLVRYQLHRMFIWLEKKQKHVCYLFL